MNRSVPDRLWTILVCPYCGASLHRSGSVVTCRQCQASYARAASGALDLRLQQHRVYPYSFTVGTPVLPEQRSEFRTLPLRRDPEVDFCNVRVPTHLSREIMSYFPKAKTENSLVLDLGCGDTIHREVCEHAGFEYVGLDYACEEASILGDAHALPFRDESFEFVLSIAVLEHIRFPFVMMKEACRVLEPNGLFIGTVAFLEPFHGDSFYHHTCLGTYNSLCEGGFTVETIAPSDKWSVLAAQAHMAFFPQMPHCVSKALVMPLQGLHKMWWKMARLVSNRASEERRITSTTGAFTFIARRVARRPGASAGLPAG